jgi:hypothetical protein
MKVFISYRRSDSADATARIHDHLEMYFGEDIVFRDIDQMKGGDDFPTRLERELSGCEIGIVVMGATWETCQQGNNPRLFDEEDPVRLEVLKLLENKKPIIPVLMDRKHMPKESELPSELARILPIQAIQISTTYDFDGGIRELVERIHEKTGIGFHDYRSLLTQCRHTGLEAFLDNFLDDRSYREEIRDAKELIVVQNDGRSWIETNQEILRPRLRDATKDTKIVLYHPQSKFLEILDAKNKKGIDRQISEIRGSFHLLMEARVHSHNFSIRAHHGFNPYSLILTENKAFMDTYLLNNRGALPRLIFTSNAPKGMYHTLRDDAYQLFNKSEDLTEDSFLKPLGV